MKSKVEEYTLTLYVIGMSERSVRAIENIKAICEEYLKGNYSLEIIDVHKQPESMFENDIIATPTLIKKSPVPIKKIIGDLSDKAKVLSGLNIRITE